MATILVVEIGGETEATCTVARLDSEELASDAASAAAVMAAGGAALGRMSVMVTWARTPLTDARRKRAELPGRMVVDTPQEGDGQAN